MVRKTGQLYQISNDSFWDYFLLALVDGNDDGDVERPAKVCLIELKTGNRNLNSVIVKSHNDITDDEFKKMLGPDDKIILSSWQEFWDDKRKNYE